MGRMLEKLKDVWKSMPRFVKIALCCLPFLFVIEDPFMGGSLITTIVRVSVGFLIMGVIYILCLLPGAIFANGEIHLLFVVLFCLVSAFILRSLSTGTANKLVWLWALVCFMMGQSYGLVLYSEWIAYSPLMHYYMIPIGVCLLPALLGILLGNLLQRWRKRKATM